MLWGELNRGRCRWWILLFERELGDFISIRLYRVRWRWLWHRARRSWHVWAHDACRRICRCMIRAKWRKLTAYWYSRKVFLIWGVVKREPVRSSIELWGRPLGWRGGDVRRRHSTTGLIWFWPWIFILCILYCGFWWRYINSCSLLL